MLLIKFNETIEWYYYSKNESKLTCFTLSHTCNNATYSGEKITGLYLLIFKEMVTFCDLFLFCRPFKPSDIQFFLWNINYQLTIATSIPTSTQYPSELEIKETIVY